jgi:hypothetical protein
MQIIRSVRGQVALLAMGMLLIIALFALGLSFVSPVAAVGEPGAGTVIGSRVGALYPATALTGSGTVQSASPRTVGGVDLSNVRYYYAVDLFVTADFASTGTLTATVQLSADGTNWADAYQLIDSGTSTASVPYRVVITGDGTQYLTLPVSGQFVRVSLQRTAAVTPTVNIHLKNTGGN